MERSYIVKANTDLPVDALLLEQARKLDPQALTTIFDTYFERLYRYAYHYVNSPEAAQDVAAETLRRLLETLHAGHSPDCLSAWLYRVAHNLAIDSIRRGSQDPVVQIDSDLPIADESNTEHEAEVRLEQQQMRLALAQLTREQRDVVVMKFLEGYSNAEVSEFLHRPEGAVKSIQHRALAALRRILGKMKGSDLTQGLAV